MKKKEYKGIYGNAIDYSVYRLSLSGILLGGGCGYAAGFLVFQIFFGYRVVSAVLAVTGLAAGILILQNVRREQRAKALLLQFSDMLEALSTSYDAGRNTQGAFGDAYQDMLVQYGREAYIVRELDIIRRGMNNNDTGIEVMLQDFAKRSHCEDIENFADVFTVANQAGANLKKVIAETKTIIVDKVNIQMELATIISGNKNELNIMILMPLIVLFSMQGMNSSTGGTSMVTIICRAAALGAFVFAYWLGHKMVQIKI